MKVLLVNKFHYLKGGSEKYYFTLAEIFKSFGHEVIFFSMKDDKNITCSQEKYFVSNASKNGKIKSKLNMLMHIAYSKEAYKNMTMLLNDENPDLVILNLVHKQLTCSVIDAIKKYNSKLPIIWVMHDLICICPSYTMINGKGEVCEMCMDGNFKHCVKNKCIHNSRFMSMLSKYEAEEIRKKNWYNKIDLYIAPSRFYEEKLKSANFTNSPIKMLRNPLGIDQEYKVSSNSDNYILYFGRLSPEKGVRTLIDVMKHIRYRLIIAGEGPEGDELKKYVVNCNLSNINFVGYKTGTELKDLIANSRCVVVPSIWYENAPYSVMETMAMGKPLIVSNMGGLPELIEDDINGYVFCNENELEKYIKLIINLEQSDYNKLCDNSVKLAKQYFNPISYVNNLFDFLNKKFE